MNNSTTTARPGFEERLKQLRTEAAAHGAVSSAGIQPVGGPLPSAAGGLPDAGYYGLPVLKPPVWKWMIAVYFFVGGIAGMSGVIAAAAWWRGDELVARFALWPAGIGALISPVLLIWDLGRPARFLNMLRVLKVQSPMSVGTWILSGFATCATLAVVLSEWRWSQIAAGGTASPVVAMLGAIVISGSGLLGMFLATYTGALLGATAIPAWNLHCTLLPLRFGIGGLGSAVAVIELAGYRSTALQVIGYFAAAIGTVAWLALEFGKHGDADSIVHEGLIGGSLRLSDLLEGLVPLVLRWTGWIAVADVSFLVGALISRFAWLAAGRASACSPASVFARQAAQDSTGAATRPNPPRHGHP